MKILADISSGSKKIATGIAIVSFLAIMYVALIPGGTTIVSAGTVGSITGSPIGQAIVKLVDYPEYNATTADGTGAYAINSVPYDSPGGSTYRISASAPGYATNTSTVTVTGNSTVKDFVLNLNAKMVGFSWITSYDAAGAATSTMGLQLPRPSDMGTEFFGQYDSRRTTAGYLTVIYVSDIYGTGANLDITYLYANGSLYNNANGIVPVNGTLTIKPGDSGLLQGKVFIKADQPVAAEKRIIYYLPGTSTVNAIMSMLLPEKSGATTTFFGQYDSRKDTAGYLTVIMLSDVFGTGANVSIEYMYANGSLYNNSNGTIPVNGTLTIRPGDIGLLQGKVKITADQPLVAEKRIINYKLGTNEVKAIMADSMNTPNDASKELISPKYDSRRTTHGWLSLIILSDIYGTGANVIADYFDVNGTLYNSTNLQVPVNGSYTILPGNTGVLEGRVNIHSDNLIVGEERIVSYAIGTSNVENIMSFNLLKENDGVIDLTIPQYDSRGIWDAEIVVSPINESSTPDFNYFTSSGVFDHKESIDIKKNGYYDFYPGDLTKGRLELGRMKIKGSYP